MFLFHKFKNGDKLRFGINITLAPYPIVIFASPIWFKRYAVFLSHHPIRLTVGERIVWGWFGFSSTRFQHGIYEKPYRAKCIATHKQLLNHTYV